MLWPPKIYDGPTIRKRCKYTEFINTLGWKTSS